jgi:hypothetical protein
MFFFLNLPYNKSETHFFQFSNQFYTSRLFLNVSRCFWTGTMVNFAESDTLRRFAAIDFIEF